MVFTSATNSTPMPHSLNTSKLVNALAEAMSVTRLPVPEPALFTGDPLKFKDWQLSFEILIDRKSIPKNEKLYYLRKVVLRGKLLKDSFC